jgi:hypothetical protein
VAVIVVALFLLAQFSRSTPSLGFSKCQSLLRGFPRTPPSSLLSFKVEPRDAHFSERAKRRGHIPTFTASLNS